MFTFLLLIIVYLFSFLIPLNSYLSMFHLPYLSENLQPGLVPCKFWPQLPAQYLPEALRKEGRRKGGREGMYIISMFSFSRYDLLQVVVSNHGHSLLFSTGRSSDKRAHFNGTMEYLNKSVTDTLTAFMKI